MQAHLSFVVQDKPTIVLNKAIKSHPSILHSSRKETGTHLSMYKHIRKKEIRLSGVVSTSANHDTRRQIQLEGGGAALAQGSACGGPNRSTTLR